MDGSSFVRIKWVVSGIVSGPAKTAVMLNLSGKALSEHKSYDRC